MDTESRKCYNKSNVHQFLQAMGGVPSFPLTMLLFFLEWWPFCPSKGTVCTCTTSIYWDCRTCPWDKSCIPYSPCYYVDTGSIYGDHHSLINRIMGEGWLGCDIYMYSDFWNGGQLNPIHPELLLNFVSLHVMAFRLFGAKPLSEPMVGYCQLDP